VGRIVDETFDDPFKLDKTDKDSNTLTVDGLPGIWAQIPLWARIAMIGLLLILLVLSLSLIINKKNRNM
jgi:Na+/H+ antiporter NhaB